MGLMEISEALRDAVAARMDELELSATDLKNATGVSGTGLANLRRGEVRDYQKRLTGPVCRVFGWTPDSIARVLRGEAPRLLDQGATGSRPAPTVPALNPSVGLNQDQKELTAWAVETIVQLDKRVAALEEALIEARDRPDATGGQSRPAGA